MSDYLLMMYQFYIINTTGTSVVTEADAIVTREALGKVVGLEVLDAQVRHFYTNFGNNPRFAKAA